MYLLDYNFTFNNPIIKYNSRVNLSVWNYKYPSVDNEVRMWVIPNPNKFKITKYPFNYFVELRKSFQSIDKKYIPFLCVNRLSVSSLKK